MNSTYGIEIDHSKPLREEPATGHNRWHESIRPVVEVESGAVVMVETRDAVDGQVSAHLMPDDVHSIDRRLVHPLTGPVFVKGAEPGDLLEAEVLSVEADPWSHRGYTVITPGLGFLKEDLFEPFVVHWRLQGNDYAYSDQLPNVRIPCNPFPGTVGVAPSADLRIEVTERELAAARGISAAFLPEAQQAVPAEEPISGEGLRTTPPRENGGNVDIKQACVGTKILLPVYVEGALVSLGDLHSAQGDGEACGQAIEVRGRVFVRFHVRKQEAMKLGIKGLQLLRDTPIPLRASMFPARFFATTGFSLDESKSSSRDDLVVAAQNAMRSMISHLQTLGYDRQQAYALCSVAVDLRISEAVNTPNVLVTAHLPLDIFVEDF